MKLAPYYFSCFVIFSIIKSALALHSPFFSRQTKIEHQIVELQTAEKALQRQKKKKTSKLKEKNLAKVAKGLDVPKEAFGADEDPHLFNLQTIKSKQASLCGR
jgi:hypothetical protein